MVQPGAQRDVEAPLVFRGPVLPAPPAGQGLGVDDPPAVDVRGAGGFLDHPEPLVVPELAHRDIGRAQRFQGVHSGIPAVSRLGQEAHAVFVQQVPDRAEMVLDDQVADGLPVVVEEPRRDPGIQGRGIEQGGEIRDRVVAVPRPESVDEIVRPIDRLADLVAVEHEGLQRVEALARAQDPVEDIGHVDRRGLAAQVVDDQAVGVRARALEGLPRVAGDEAHDPRRPGRGVPVQAALGVHAGPRYRPRRRPPERPAPRRPSNGRSRRPGAGPLRECGPGLGPRSAGRAAAGWRSRA